MILKKERTCGAFLLLWTSLLLLYPAIRGTLMHFELTYAPLGSTSSVTLIEVTRSLWGKDSEESIIGLCFDSNKAWVAYCLIFFGIIIPAIKGIAFHIWLVASTESSTGRCVERFIQSASAVSRWSAVDVCAECLFAGMLMQSPVARLELLDAYWSFVAYCILSTSAFLVASPDQRSTKTMQTALGRRLCRNPSLLTVTTITFFVVICLGVGLPSIKLVLSEAEIRKKAQEVLPTPVFYVIQDDLVEEMSVTVTASIWSCMKSIIESGMKYAACSTALLFFCVIIVPAADVVLGTISAFVEISGKDEIALSSSKQMERMRHILQQYAMLDVLVIGILLGAQVMDGSYAVTVQQNFWYLVAAVVVWYAHSWMCSAVTATSRFSRLGEETKLLGQNAT